MKSKQLDQWYTSNSAVKLIVESLPVSLKTFSEVIDPCAGSGAFMGFCDKLYDIDPKQDFIQKQDFLDMNLPFDSNRLFLTNFPYGRAASLSIDMINHASTMADNIVTVVPMTMKRYSRQRRVNKDLKLLWEMELPKYSFTLDGKSVDVPSLVQWWSRDDSCLCLRVSEPVSVSDDFIISSRYNPNAEFVIRGVRPLISNDIDIYNRISDNTRYYSVEPLSSGVEEIFRSIDLVAACVSTGMPCLSIPECIEAYNNAKSDWYFDNKNYNCFVIGASRKIITVDEITDNHRGYKIHSNIPVEDLQKRFNIISWVGSSSVSGGVFWLGKEELRKQYDILSSSI